MAREAATTPRQREGTNLVPWSADNRWEDGSWCIITSETRFTHSRTIVDDKSSYIVVTHFSWLKVMEVGWQESNETSEEREREWRLRRESELERGDKRMSVDGESAISVREK